MEDWERTRSRSSGSPRPPANNRAAHLETTMVNPVVVIQINRRDARMPPELVTMLNTLDGFQGRVGIVPDYLAVEIEARAKGDRELHNFQSSTFSKADKTTTGAPIIEPKILLDRVLEVLSAARECLNWRHSEATWNTLVHWPVFQLALGSTAVIEAAGKSEGQKHQVFVGAMPCTEARLQGRSRGAKMVNYCIFVVPQGEDYQQIYEMRQAGYYVNHTDYPPLRHRPIVLSATSLTPGENYQDAQIQLGAWQAAQWTFLKLASSGVPQSTLIPFLPALIIEGHEWSFAATTKVSKHTVLWLKQTIGSTHTALGMFQIIHALRYIATWIRDTYWPWYKKAILEGPRIGDGD
ncbi:hypothetical protein F4825DRAFT_462784 [Nemania diffusa]|nr:hypothetical protein F4825DRAFT_462784 [Nemania diffusa]